MKKWVEFDISTHFTRRRHAQRWSIFGYHNQKFQVYSRSWNGFGAPVVAVASKNTDRGTTPDVRDATIDGVMMEEDDDAGAGITL